MTSPAEPDWSDIPEDPNAEPDDAEVTHDLEPPHEDADE